MLQSTCVNRAPASVVGMSCAGASKLYNWMMSAIPVQLPAELERFVTDQVKQGNYASPEAAIVAAVDRERRRAEQQAWLASEIQKGLDSGPAGELDMEDIIRRGKARLAARKPQ